MKIMKHIIKLFSVSVFLILGATACVKDSTNEDFVTLNDVTIKNLADSYTVQLYDKLVVNPSIQTVTGDESNLDFAWYVYTKETVNKADTLSHEKNLNVEIRNQIPGNIYHLVFKVTDKKTGVFYNKLMDLKVTGVFSSGTMLLCKTGTKNEVHFIQPDGTLIDDVYSKSNSDEVLQGNPTVIFMTNPNSNFASSLKRVFIMCNSEDGGAIVDPVTFKRESWFRNYFVLPPTLNETPTFSVKAYHKGSLFEYFICNGELYNRASNMGEPLLKPPFVRITEPTKYDLAPIFACSWGSDPVMYDNLNGRFLNNIAGPREAQGVIFTFTGSDKTYFDYDNVGLKMIYAGALSTSNSFFGLFKDEASNKLYILKWSTTAKNNFTTLAKIEVNPTIAPHLSQATCYLTDNDYKGVLFYAAGGVIYGINVDTFTGNSSAEAILLDYSSENITVDCMDFYKFTRNNIDTYGIRLGVRKSDYTSTKKGGIIYTEASSVGGLNLVESSRKLGFCDKVIDIEEKED